MSSQNAPVVEQTTVDAVLHCDSTKAPVTLIPFTCGKKNAPVTAGLSGSSNVPSMRRTVFFCRACPPFFRKSDAHLPDWACLSGPSAVPSPRSRTR